MPVTREGLHISRVNKLPAWMYKGLGVNGGGDLVRTVEINGEPKYVYVSWHGINYALTPGYFPMEGVRGYDDMGRVRTDLTWYRIKASDPW